MKISKNVLRLLVIAIAAGIIGVSLTFLFLSISDRNSSDADYDDEYAVYYADSAAESAQSGQSTSLVPATYSPLPEMAREQLLAFNSLVLSLHEPSNDTLVAVKDYIPNIYVELKYATADNITGQVIYDFDTAYLRYGTVKKLKAVQEKLEAEGLSLCIWDAARPVYAQYKLYSAVPNSTYVANPNGGYSTHSRGNTVDVTLCDSEGNLLEMPSGFDDFTRAADRSYYDVSSTAAANSNKLTALMKDGGFTIIYSEWWHFVDSVSYGVLSDSDFKAQ